MCWVMPPASPETTLVLRIASSSEVLPWSTWPMMVTTGGARLQVALVVAGGLDDHVLDVGLRDAADPVAELLDDQRRGVGVDGLVLRRHDAVLHQGLDHGGDALGHAVGELLHGDRVGHLHVAHDLLAFAGMAGQAALLALLAALHRGQRALAALLVGGVGDGQLARAAAVVLALGARALLLGRRGLSGARLRRATGAAGLGARRLGLGGGGVDRPAAAGRAAAAPWPRAAARGGGLGLPRRPRRRRAARRSRARGPRARRPPSRRAAARARPRAPRRPRAPSAGARPPAPWRPRPPSGGARTRRRDRFCCAAPRGAGRRRRAAPAFGTTTRLRLCSTVTDFVRPWLKLWRTWLVSVAAAAQPERLALAVAVLGIHHSVSAFPAGAFPRHIPSPAPFAGRRADPSDP